ncbi:helix-turn-helix domain-containing protein [Robertkochia solimangrovi]|uniref:helix-turn-helix domain-containing protein n=1 Tax=Robertkochia solimangrovi TaxID=2213046 RepID=UPI001180A7E6|nr:helix-turn-helix domain-containing protein [Robertkochia solimangrovi]TRZ45340.1 AraC family transcriptional regulator [Robertkochia solimangrovi]
MKLPTNYLRFRKVTDMIDNKTSFNMDEASLHIFETFEEADNFHFQFDEMVIGTMVTGQKVINMDSGSSFEFNPGESVIIPAGHELLIDFPMASMENPTQCLAYAISKEKIDKVVEKMNYFLPKEGYKEWKFVEQTFHFTNDIAVNDILHRLMYLFMEEHPHKDIFIDNMLSELIMRILQNNNRHEMLSNGNFSNNRMAYCINHIRQNLHRGIKVEELSNIACMSESNFHRVFKNEFGISPVDFIINERIKLASRLLRDPEISIKEVYLRCGFENRSYFNRVFKRIQNLSPSEFQNRYFMDR